LKIATGRREMHGWKSVLQERTASAMGFMQWKSRSQSAPTPIDTLAEAPRRRKSLITVTPG
jgi:hypothetical protein